MTQPPFGSGMMMAPPPQRSPMKFTTFHQHQQQTNQLSSSPINGNNGNFNGSGYQTQTIQLTQQQMYMKQQPHHHHQQQQQFYENNPQIIPPNVNYVSNSSYTKMSAPLGTPQQLQQQQQRSTAIWHQQYTSTSPMKDFNGSNDSG
jgi:hypothetical protein